MSFLKEWASGGPWTTNDLAASLRISTEEANTAVPVLQLAGYLAPAGSGKWRVTTQGAAVAGAQRPRFKRTSVERAIQAFKERVEALNRDDQAQFEVLQAVVFGDYLSGGEMLQPAEVGVELASRAGSRSAPEPGGGAEALKRLKARSPMLTVRTMEEWMRSRQHLAIA